MTNIYDKAKIAQKRLEHIVMPSTLGYAPVLSRIAGAEIYLKKRIFSSQGRLRFVVHLIKSPLWWRIPHR